MWLQQPHVQQHVLCSKQQQQHPPLPPLRPPPLGAPATRQRRRAQPQPQRATSVRRRAFTLRRVDGGSGGDVAVDDKQQRFVLGSGSDADLRVSGDNVAPQHAALTQRGRQVYFTALVGEGLWDDTHSYVDGEQARPHVAYLLAAGSRVALGGASAAAPAAAFAVDFDEPSGGNPLVEMLMRGAAAGVDPAVRERLAQQE